MTIDHRNPIDWQDGDGFIRVKLRAESSTKGVIVLALLPNDLGGHNGHHVDVVISREKKGFDRC